MSFGLSLSTKVARRVQRISHLMCRPVPDTETADVRHVIRRDRDTKNQCCYGGFVPFGLSIRSSLDEVHLVDAPPSGTLYA